MFDFSTIDEAIQKFRTGKFGIYISKKAKTDWFVFQYRSIEWEKGKLNFMIEIFPDLDKEGNSVSWNFTAMVHFDENRKRYFQKYSFVKSVSFEKMKNVFINTLLEEYDTLNNLDESKIEFEFIPIAY